MPKTVTTKWKQTEAQREQHAKLDAALTRRPVVELVPDDIAPELADLSPEQLAEEVQRREREKAATLAALGYGANFTVAEPEPVVVPERPTPVTEVSGPTVAEVEAQMKAEEARLAEQIAELEERSKRRLIELAMARAEAENAEEARSRVDTDAALEAYTQRVAAPKRDLAAEQLAEARARFAERAKPYKQELAAATKAFADFEERYGARLDALEKIERSEWLNGQPSDGKHQQASLAVTHQLMMMIAQLNQLRRELPSQFRYFRDELKYLHDWAGIERPPYGSAQQFLVAAGQILGTGATAPSINQGNLRLAISTVPSLQSRVDHIVTLLGVVTERQKAGAPPIEFDKRPPQRDPSSDPLSHEHGPSDYTVGAPSLFGRR
jgi:hypothetical protein